jgi:glycosyltransferase involved in cell wall biosynthesis
MAKKIKVFIDADVLTMEHFSGIGHYTASILKATDRLLKLDEYRHISITLGVPLRQAHRLNRFEFENFSVRRMPVSTRIVNGLKQSNKLPPIDILYGKQVYIFPNYSSWPALFSPIIPIVYDLSFIKYPQYGDAHNMKFLVEQVEKSIKRSKRVITISENSKREINEYYKVPNSSINIVYPIIETREFYKRSSREVEEIKAKYCIFGDYILFVGNLEPRKNLNTLLDAYAKLPVKFRKKYSLLLVGAKGWNDDNIHAKIQSMRMKGMRVIQPISYVTDEDLPALISGASLFAYVSIYEGFGIPPVEALACGTPTISSNNSSLPEAVGHGAKMVNATDTDEISDAIIQTLQNPPDSSEGYTQAMKFDAESAAKSFLKTIEEAAR